MSTWLFRPLRLINSEESGGWVSEPLPSSFASTLTPKSVKGLLCAGFKLGEPKVLEDPCIHHHICPFNRQKGLTEGSQMLPLPYLHHSLESLNAWQQRTCRRDKEFRWGILKLSLLLFFWDQGSKSVFYREAHLGKMTDMNTPVSKGGPLCLAGAS